MAELQQDRWYGTGRRKSAVARVWIQRGSGKIIINKRDIEEYFPRKYHRLHALEPLRLTEMENAFDIFVNVKGGGMTGQSGAIRLGIARALIEYSQDLRPVLKKAGTLTRDPRVVERKKYGRPKARKRFQFSKR